MDSHRSVYPSGAASASDAYRYTGDTLHSFDASLLGLSIQEDRGIQSNSLGPWGRGGLYGYESALNYMNGEEPRQLQAASLRAHNIEDGYLNTHADPRGSLRDSEFLTRPYPMHYFASDENTMAPYGTTLLTGSNSFDVLSAESDIRSYGHVSEEYHNKVNKTSNTCLPAPMRKRKTLSLDEIIRETWDLHSLFRTGHAAVSNATEDCTELGWSPDVKPIPREPLLDKSWDVATNSGIYDTTRSWMELMPTKESKGAISNKRLKESLPNFDLEQEYHSSGLQRAAAAKVGEFLGSDSDDNNSDSDAFEDSEGDTPKVTTESLGDYKSREEQAFEFFSQTFEESKELQKLYSEQCHVGRFECLVCSSIPGKPVKKYNGLVSVIMHASKIIKTKKKQEHRGYARALCATMGWDLCRLPTMASSSSPHLRCCIPANEQEETTEAKWH